jgi:hypothetical protein
MATHITSDSEPFTTDFFAPSFPRSAFTELSQDCDPFHTESPEASCTGPVSQDALALGASSRLSPPTQPSSTKESTVSQSTIQFRSPASETFNRPLQPYPASICAHLVSPQPSSTTPSAHAGTLPVPRALIHGLGMPRPLFYTARLGDLDELMRRIWSADRTPISEQGNGAVCADNEEEWGKPLVPHPHGDDAGDGDSTGVVKGAATGATRTGSQQVMHLNPQGVHLCSRDRSRVLICLPR